MYDYQHKKNNVISLNFYLFKMVKKIYLKIWYNHINSILTRMDVDTWF